MENFEIPDAARDYPYINELNAKANSGEELPLESVFHLLFHELGGYGTENYIGWVRKEKSELTGPKDDFRKLEKTTLYTDEIKSKLDALPKFANIQERQNLFIHQNIESETNDVNDHTDKANKANSAYVSKSDVYFNNMKTIIIDTLAKSPSSSSAP
jgi:hypothetical protein